MSQGKAILRVGISCGDINGIGMEVILRTFEDARMLQDMIPVLYASVRTLGHHRKAMGADEVPVHGIADASEAVPRKLNVVNLWEEDVPVEFGKPSGERAKYAIRSLEAATQDIAAGKVDVLVTAPIDKHAMEAAGFAFAGHTEYLKHMANVEDVLMILMDLEGNLRVGTVTGHIPLASVAQEITQEKILSKARLFAQSLEKDLGVPAPRIALLGINPHAGDNGTLGSEERERILPAIRQLVNEGLQVMGPYAADGFFGSGAYRQFDGVLAMYHDQGLAPFKALSFGHGVNFTGGLPIVRTSPDHGTGFDIAGKGLADPGSFRAAVWMASDVFFARQRHKELTSNPLQSQETSKRSSSRERER